MKISSVQNRIYAAGFRAQNPQIATPKTKSVSPLNNGLNTAGVWFGFGIVLDLLSRKIKFSQSPLKNSFALNGIIGAGAGIVAAVQSWKNKTIQE